MNMAITLFGAADAMLTSILVGRAASRLWLAATLLGLSAGLAAAVVVLGGDAERGWHSRLTLGGEALPLRLEAISAFYLMLLCVVGGAASVYEREHWADRTHPRSSHTGRVWWSVLLLSLGLVLLVSNGRPFLLAWELFTISAYFLATLNRQPAVVRAAGWLYLRAAHVAVLALFAFFTLLAARAWSWDLGPMRERADLAPLFWLALLGFGLKAGLFPLHVWLPSAHANAPSHVSAMLSGVTLKIGIYGLVRFSGWQPVAGGAGWVVAALGVVSAVLACFVKVCGVVFLGAPRSKEAAHECGLAMRGAMLVLAGAGVAIGLAPIVFWPAITRAAGTWHPAWAGSEAPASLVSLGMVHVGLAVLAAATAWWLWWRVQDRGLRHALTWGCGCVSPSARMQYTAGSFAGIITEWFAFILRTERHEHLPVVIFPQVARLTEHTPETLLERVIEPVGRSLLWGSLMARRLQHGRVQSYDLYLLIDLAALTAFMLLGGGL